MSKIQAETIARELTDRLNSLHASSATYVGDDDFEFRRLLRDCDKLISADAINGYACRGLAHVLTGNVDELYKHMEKAKAISGEATDFCDFMLAQALAKLGYFSRAQALFIPSADPALGRFGHRSKAALGMGAVIALSEMFESADAMKLAYHSPVDREETEAMASIMREAGVTDGDLAAMMDFAGLVARNHGLRIKQQEIRLLNLDGEKFVHVEVKVDCSAREAADMVFEVAELVSESDRSLPAIHVSFGTV